jgi:hydrogenase maturation protein HypF
LAELASNILPATKRAIRIVLSGHVQGVGFRPFVYRLARQHNIKGQVQNQLGEVEVIAVGTDDSLQQFQRGLVEQAPPLSRPNIESICDVEIMHFDSFDIATSSAQADARIFVPQDFFMCDDCRRELGDETDRRYGYPFINCTQCGPRYTLIEALPYDRPNTSMAGFPLCEDCDKEYLDPGDRRFHAEPVACPTCGPQLSFHDSGDVSTLSAAAALEAALEALRNGQIVAVKGIGGYHLMCDARSQSAVAELRQRKQRPAKPLAVMFPLAGEDGLDIVGRYANLTAEEKELLTSPGRPIVLTTKSAGNDLADNIAAGLAEIGAFLPYSPLHQLLLDGFGGPLVATSANISGEPVLTQNNEVEERLDRVVDGFLHHNRPIVRPADDPVYRCIAGAVRPLRIGRGCAPLEMQIPHRQQRPVLAVGGHMKGTVALSWDDRVVVSPHIGEMDNPRSLAVFEQVANDLQELYGVQAERIICDAHSGYTTHRWAKRQLIPSHEVYHHHAHASAVAGEYPHSGSWLIFAWDGVGLGEDNTLWGGEALFGQAGAWRRVASLRSFSLPGGDRVGREPWRSAAALNWTCERPWPECPDTDGLLYRAWRQNLNCPQTSAAGRLFDAAAALITGVTHTSFEAEGPMLLETLCRMTADPVELPLIADAEGVWRADWEPLLPVITDSNRGKSERAAIFHASMARVILQQARQVRAEKDIAQVGLCGGVFQNRVLAEQAVALLEDDGFNVCLPQLLPCNDAALSYGQAEEFAASQQDR